MRILTKVAIAVLASAICVSTAQAGVATYVGFGESWSFGHNNNAYAGYNAHPGLNYTTIPSLDTSGGTRFIDCTEPTGCSIGLTGTAGLSPTATSSFNTLLSTTDGRRYSAVALTDLSTGKIGVSASSSSGVLGEAMALGQLGDGLNFAIAGASASTVTNIGVTFDIHGTRSITSGAISVTNILRFGDAGFDYSLSQRDLNPPTISTYSPFGWVSYSIDTSVPDHTTFTGVYALQGASQRLMFGEGFWTTAGGIDASSDYASTSAFSFSLPSEVTFTSDSGVFLTGLGGGGGVPEPATWALMITGFGLVGSALRRRRLVAA